MSTRINEKQARVFALAIVSDIAGYIKLHEAEYKAYLLRTGQADENYPPENTKEAADGQD